ncbi:STAS/SEC14 domain-containing protein [Arthrobacter sp. AK01]|uniref:DUF7793 family protein n=1 Tax=Arthrobacter sp. AK01 TaxID=2894084 RepID=UPI001E457009|nr:STAS/SEC14 domain-containing protein [Arthrobacter sp. AK01]MCD4851787.1 STAS/SEC14 domain-containing protein [Arthrobacter sp. AK01]
MAQKDPSDYFIGFKAGDVMFLAWKPGVRIEAANARAAVEAVNRLAAGSRYPLLVTMADTAHLSRAARDVFVEPCAASRIALLGNNPVDRMLADYQLAVQEPPCPTRFFTSETEAISWLRSSSEDLQHEEHKDRSGSGGRAAP